MRILLAGSGVTAMYKIGFELSRHSLTWVGDAMRQHPRRRLTWVGDAVSHESRRRRRFKRIAMGRFQARSNVLAGGQRLMPWYLARLSPVMAALTKAAAKRRERRSTPCISSAGPQPVRVLQAASGVNEAEQVADTFQTTLFTGDEISDAMTAASLPTWVRTRDGRLWPFDPERIRHDFFAAAMECGLGDVVLLRELSDSVLHFLADGSHATTVSSDELRDRIVTLIRELGQPQLAMTFARHRKAGPSQARPRLDSSLSPAQLIQQSAEKSLADFSLREVYPAEVAAAHRDGLLVLSGLHHPLELSGSILSLNPENNFSDALNEARNHTGGWVAIDGPEYLLHERSGEPSALVTNFADQLICGLEALHLIAAVNLNQQAPPPWATELGAAPLFVGDKQPWDQQRLRVLTCCLLSKLTSRTDSSRISVIYHLAAQDFSPEGVHELKSLARIIDAGMPVQLLFDRGTPSSLGGGVTRNRPSVLAEVGVHLSRFADRVAGDADKFLRKLGALARLARSAGHAKLDFLRSHGRTGLTGGFRLERSRLMVVPLGLEAVTARFTGRRLCDGGAAIAFASKVVHALSNALTTESPRIMESFIDSPLRPNLIELDDAPGISPWDQLASCRLQIQTAGELHAIAGTGTGLVLRRAEVPVQSQDTHECLNFAWRNTHVRGLQFHRPKPKQKESHTNFT